MVIVLIVIIVVLTSIVLLLGYLMRKLWIAFLALMDCFQQEQETGQPSQNSNFSTVEAAQPIQETCPPNEQGEIVTGHSYKDGLSRWHLTARQLLEREREEDDKQKRKEDQERREQDDIEERQLLKQDRDRHDREQHHYQKQKRDKEDTNERAKMQQRIAKKYQELMQEHARKRQELERQLQPMKDELMQRQYDQQPNGDTKKEKMDNTPESTMGNKGVLSVELCKDLGGDNAVNENTNKENPKENTEPCCSDATQDANQTAQVLQEIDGKDEESTMNDHDQAAEGASGPESGVPNIISRGQSLSSHDSESFGTAHQTEAEAPINQGMGVEEPEETGSHDNEPKRNNDSKEESRLLEPDKYENPG